MKHFASLYKIIGAVLVAFFFIPQTIFADTDIHVSSNTDGSSNSVNVDQQSSDQGTVCVNGNCTTEGGDSKATVCINGQCTTANGTSDVQLDEGLNQPSTSSATENSITVTPEPTEVTPSNTTVPAVTEDPTITPDPTIMQMRQDINNQIKKQEDTIKEHVKEQDAAISSFIKSEMDALQNFFNSLFK